MQSHKSESINTNILELSPLEFVMMMSSLEGRTHYASVSRDPSFVGERKKDVYRCATYWQAENFLVEVDIGYYWTQAEAEAAGIQPMKLVLDGGSWRSPSLDILRLVTLDGKPIETLAPNGEHLDWLLDQDVKVFKLKDSCTSKKITSLDDYEAESILIDNFELHSELRTFGSLSAGAKLVASLSL